MKYLIFALAVFAAPSFAKDVYVQPHITKSGTYVEGHHRSAPDSNPYNNYSAKGNSNPYTGQQGYVQSQPTYQQPAPAYQPYKPYQPYQPR